jgi:hypothetical protein
MDETTSLFNYRDPRSMMADRYAGAYQPLSGSLDQMTIQLGGNAGAMVGNALFGGKTSAMAEQSVLNEAIKESEAAEDPDERLSLFAAALRKRGLEGYAQKAEMQLLERQRKRADIDRLRAIANRPVGGGGTGPERMAAFVANVQARLAAGETVPEEERLRAQGFADVLSRNQFFQQEDGAIVNVPKNDFGRIRSLLDQGAIEIPSSIGTPSQQAPQGTQTPPTQGGQTPRPLAASNVIPTPDSTAAAAKKAESDRQNQVVFESDINQIDKALNTVRTAGRRAAGIGSWLAFIPESSASSLADTIESIDAAKLIQQIQALKQASPTGSTGFGSLTEKEGLQLINRLGSIKQTKSPQELEASLLEVRGLLGKLAGKESAPSGGASANEELIKRVMADPRNKGKTRQQIEAGLRKRGLIK